MKEYSVDEIINQKDGGEPKYLDVGDYEISISETEYTEKGNGPYKFYTVVEKYNKEIGWLPDSEQQHVNPQKGVKLQNITQNDIIKMIQQIYSIKARKNIKSELILERHKPLVEKMLTDYIKFDYKKNFKK